MKQHIRNSATCLNCGATVAERYCTRCGQENVELKESFGHLLHHFVEDLTHYDSKFFLTIRQLLLKPGFLTKAYINGKRASYLHPIRMYFFISFIYFLLIFTFKKPLVGINEAEAAAIHARIEIADSLKKMTVPGKNDVLINNIVTHLHLDTLAEYKEMRFTILGSIDNKTLRAYDSAQSLLPVAQRDKGLKPWLYKRWLNTLNHYGIGALDLVAEKTMHIIPKLMFVFLPLFALLLKWLYNRKKYWYTDHVIFSLHFHSVIFLMFSVFFILGQLIPALLPYLDNIELLVAFVYLVIALRTVYEQKTAIALLKAAVLTVCYLSLFLAGFLLVALWVLL